MTPLREHICGLEGVGFCCPACEIVDDQVERKMSVSPFYITGPAAISFSGGRTSGYMLRRILDVHGGKLPADVHVLFANTGKEFEETLSFVHDVSRWWNVPIQWLERVPGGGYRVTCFEGASRVGQPFEQLIHERRFLPNPVARFCTSELKLAPIRDWMSDHGYGLGGWDSVVGIRSDEPKRVAKMRERGLLVPLADAGITREDVMAFWRRQDFDLGIAPHESNCDLCFLKGYGLRQQIARDYPSRTVWWIRQEQTIGGTFRSDAPSYSHLLDQRDLFNDESLVDCYCTD